MSLHAKQYIPIPVSEATLDWARVGERIDAEGIKKTQVFLISVPNNIIESVKKIFSSADLELSGLEIEGAGIARSLTLNKKDPTLIVDIGSRSTSIIIAKEGHLLFVSQTDFAGGSLTQVIANALRLSSRRAEDLKRKRGLVGAGPEQELSTIIEPIIDVIINESVRAKQNYENTYKAKVSGVILSGGGANLPGLVRYFSNALGMPVSKAEPFAGLIHTAEMNPFINELGPLFSVAIGLAMKE
jgi:type IV pilus assembly protein PilM